MDAAASPGWSIGLGRRGQIMATLDTGVVGMPLVVLAEKHGRGMRVSRFEPGDDTEVEGDLVGELTGNPREMGRQLRRILEESEPPANY